MTAQNITISSISQLFTIKGAYFIGYSWLFGMSLWVTFFGGVIAFRTLPRQQFGTLQHRTFPVYFLISVLVSSGLLGFWTISHPDVVPNIWNPAVANVLQAYTLASVLIAQAINYFIIGPLTTKTKFQRQKLEKAEGRTYDEPGVSVEMKALNSRFSQFHGISSLANLCAVVALGFHGLWIGNIGI